MTSIVEIKIGRTNQTFDSYESFCKGIGSSATAVKRALDQGIIRKAVHCISGEQYLRLTWSKATRRYPSKPSLSVVTVADDEFSPMFAITDRSEKVAKSTLYRVPQFDQDSALRPNR